MVCTAIPFVQEVAPTAYGWHYDTPRVHRMRDTTIDFLDELRDRHISLPIDDSYDVTKHHDSMHNAI